MGSQPEVTVIIPNYNGKQLLENCIATLEQQTCPCSGGGQRIHGRERFGAVRGS